MTNDEIDRLWMYRKNIHNGEVMPQLRDFARAIEQASRHAALEESAKVCDDFGVDRWNLYKGRAPYTGSEDGRANSYVEGEADGAGKCADAIRALFQQPAKGG